MSMQTFRVCDLTSIGLDGGPGELCRRPFKAVCPICEQDRCREHLNDSGTIRLHAMLGRGSSTPPYEIGAAAVTTVCSSCLSAMAGLTVSTLDGVLSPLSIAIVEAVRAALSAKAMSK